MSPKTAIQQSKANRPTSTQFIFFSGSSDFRSSTFPESDFPLGATGKANIDDLTKLVDKWLRDRSEPGVHDGK
jgi:hypothetical protein